MCIEFGSCSVGVWVNCVSLGRERGDGVVFSDEADAADDFRPGDSLNVGLWGWIRLEE